MNKNGNVKHPVNREQFLFNLGLCALRKISLKDIKRKKAYCCLLYHSVIRDEYNNKVFNNSTKVKESTFLMHMENIKEYCVPISLTKMIEMYKKGIKPDKFYVSLTFDDGYEDNFTVAYPILKSLKIPATIFLTTGFIDNKNKLPWWDELEFIANNINSRISLEWNGGKYHFDLKNYTDKTKFLKKTSLLTRKDVRQADSVLERLYNDARCNRTKQRNSFLNWSQIREMARSDLIDFAPHTVNHPDMSLIAPSDFFEEVIESAKRIKEEIKTVKDFFVYPYGGDYGSAQNLREYFIENNFVACFSSDFGYITPKSDPFFLKRITINDRDSRSSFMNKLLFPGILGKFNELRRTYGGVLSF